MPVRMNNQPSTPIASPPGGANVRGPVKKLGRPFGFLFNNLRLRRISDNDILRLSVAICLVVGLFGVEGLTSRAGESFIGARIGNLGAALNYFQFYLWVPVVLFLSVYMFFRGVFFKIVQLNFLAIALAVFVLYSANYSESADIARFRTEIFLTNVLPVVVCGVVCADLKSVLAVRDMILVYAMILFIALAISPTGLVSIIHGQAFSMVDPESNRLIISNNVITTGYQMALLSLIAFLVFNRGVVMHNVERYGLLVIMGLAVGLLLLTGTRGALAGLLAAIGVFFLRRGKAKWAITTFAFLVFLFAGMLFFGLISSYLTERYQSTFTTGSMERQLLSIAALSTPLTLFGNGVGSFGAEWATVGQPVYTHNVFTELYYEGGFVGLSLFVLACVTAFVRLWRASKQSDSEMEIFCLTGFVFYFVFAQFSGYLLANAGFWLFLTMGSVGVQVSGHKNARKRKMRTKDPWAIVRTQSW